MVASVDDINDKMNNISIDENDSISQMISTLQNLKYENTTKMLNITEKECIKILEKAHSIFKDEPSLLELSPSIQICGDIHGQFYDLLRIFECLEYPPQTRYLFLGDYVDRGKQSIETILLLFCLKIKYPQSIFLLRGNHESSEVNREYGFYDECKRKISVKIHKRFTEVFNIMPISAIIEGKIFCVHGGLSEDLKQLHQIKMIKRPTEIPDKGLLCDLLWSDPSDDINTKWGPNEREVSFTFSKEVVKDFTDDNNLDLICRAHQVVQEGYEFFADMKLVTVFSAPSYMGEFDNYGAVLNVSEDLVCSFSLMSPIMEKKKKKRGRIKKLVN